MNVYQKFEQIADSQRDKVAIINGMGKRWTYGDVMFECDQLQKLVIQKEISLNDRVGVLCSSDLASIYILGLMNVCQVVPVALDATDKEKSNLLRSVDAKLLLTNQTISSQLRDQLADNSTEIIELIAPCEEGHVLAMNAEEDATALILQTSGSTAEPKLVPITHQSILNACKGSADSLALTTEDICLNFMPLTHVHGLISGSIITLLTGGSLIIFDNYVGDRFASWLEVFKPTWLSTTPVIYRDILKRNKSFKHHHLRFIRSGAANMPEDMAKQLENAFEAPLLNAYGMTETLQLTGNPIAKPKHGSVGKSIGAEIVIHDVHGRLCAPNESGKVMARGSTVFSGYLSGGAIRGEPSSGWFFTGDLGYLDEEGYLFLSGREKDLINKGGERISPQEIEATILKHPAVDSCVVLGIPHEKLDEDIGVAIVLKKNQTVDHSPLKDFLSEHLSQVKIPTQMVFINGIPEGKNGKVDRLAVLDLLSVRSEEKIEEELSATQQFLQEKYKQVLGVDAVSLNEDFFAIGGSSLDAAQFVQMVSDDLGETIHVVSFMGHPTIAGFASFLERNYAPAINSLLNLELQQDTSKRMLRDDEIGRFRASLSQAFHPNQGSIAKGTNPVFILSAPRSGSTLLRVMLAGHSQLFSPPELRLMQYTSLDEWKEHLSGEFAFFQEGLQVAIQHAFGFPVDQAIQWIEEQADIHRPIVEIYDEISKAIGPRILVDKTPTYALSPAVLSAIGRSFPTANFIFLQRNPEHAIESYVRNKMEQVWMFADNYQPQHRAEMIWLESNRNILNFLAGIPESRQVSVQYENLIELPNVEIQRICTLLELPMENEMLQPHTSGSRKMTLGSSNGSKMIGDPIFMNKRGIQASAKSLSKRIGESAQLHPETMALAERMDYLDYEGKGKKTINEDAVLESLRKLVSTWKGVQLGSSSLIFGRNTGGSRTPIFWCFQGNRELRVMAENLGEDQPIYGMRSGHLLCKRDTPEILSMAREYAKEIQTLYPHGPLILGGNCQGASVIWEVAEELISLGREVEKLILMEREILKPYNGHIMYLFGRNSPRHNPFFFRENPEALWEELYDSFEVNFLEGEHGQFFDGENAKVLTDFISNGLVSSD